MSPGGGAVWGRRQHRDPLGGSAAQDRQRGPKQDRRLQAPRDRGRVPHVDVGPDQGEGLHPARAGGRTRRARAEGGLPLGLDFRPRREAELQKKAWWLANAIDLTSRADGRNGSSTRTALILPAWSSSTRPGPEPTWHRYAAGLRVAAA